MDVKRRRYERVESPVRLLYLLSHVGLGQVVEDESNLLLDVVWRLDNPFRLVSGHQQGVDVGCVYRGLQEDDDNGSNQTIPSSAATQR